MKNKQQTYTRTEVKDIILDAITNSWTEEDKWIWFEKWLNDRGLNWNNWANEHLMDEFLDETAESLL